MCFMINHNDFCILSYSKQTLMLSKEYYITIHIGTLFINVFRLSSVCDFFYRNRISGSLIPIKGGCLETAGPTMCSE